MEQAHLEQAEKYPVLGPHYFAAREAAEKFMAAFEAEQFAPLLKKAADDFYGQLHERLENFLLSDVENNLQGTIWRQIDESVKALLTGQHWAIQRYALGERYDHGRIREVLASLIPAELQDKRVADLEAEVKELKQSLEWERRR